MISGSFVAKRRGAIASLLVMTLLLCCACDRVQVASSPAEAGTVSSKKYKYSNGEKLLDANAEPGYVFDHWEGDISGDFEPIIVPNEKARFVACFRPTGTVPLVLEGMQEQVVRTVSLTIGQSYPNVTDPADFKLDMLYDTISGIFGSIGVAIVAQEEPHDAALVIEARCLAIEKIYYDTASGYADYYYIGAELEGNATLTVDGHDPVSFKLSREYDPEETYVGMGSCRRPADARFSYVWEDAVLELIGEVWGEEAPLRVLLNWEYGCHPGGYYTQRADAVREYLTSALSSGDSEVRYQATRAMWMLGIATRDTVPALLQALYDPAESNWIEALYLLHDISPLAEDALPEIVEWANTGHGYSQLFDSFYLDETVRLIADEQSVWACNSCGHMVIGDHAPEVCPACGRSNKYYEITWHS